MSDKTKKMADEALMARRFREREDQRHLPEVPRCACGLTHQQTTIYEDCPASRLEPVRYWCAVCVPDDRRDWVMGLAGKAYEGDGPQMKVVK